jgi:voltage-gated potassium channel Kch
LRKVDGFDEPRFQALVARVSSSDKFDERDVRDAFSTLFRQFEDPNWYDADPTTRFFLDAGRLPRVAEVVRIVGADVVRYLASAVMQAEHLQDVLAVRAMGARGKAAARVGQMLFKHLHDDDASALVDTLRAVIAVIDDDQHFIADALMHMCFADPP